MSEEKNKTADIQLRLLDKFIKENPGEVERMKKVAEGLNIPGPTFKEYLDHLGVKL